MELSKPCCVRYFRQELRPPYLTLSGPSDRPTFDTPTNAHPCAPPKVLFEHDLMVFG